MIILDYRDRRPIYEQIVEKMSELMIKGILPKDAPLPSVRAFAAELSINPNTVQRAYIELERRGIIYSVKGKGSFVAGSNTLIEEKKNDLKNEFCTLLIQAAELGIGRAELEKLMDDIYSGKVSDSVKTTETKQEEKHD